MNRARATLLIADREVREAMRHRLFWVVIAALMLGTTAALVIPDLIGDEGATDFDVSVVGDSESAENSFSDILISLGPAFDADIRLVPVEDADDARGLVDDKKVDLAVVLGGSPTIIVRAGQSDRLLRVVTQALSTTSLVDRLIDAGLTPDEAADALSGPAVQVVELDPQSESRMAASFALSLVLYLLLLMVMVQVANGIAIEKANRISEVLLGIVRPGPLMFGKVLGVGLLGVLALLAASTPVLVKLLIGGDVPEGIGGALAGGLVWFVLGLAFYLVIAAALGAMVERQEEAGTVITPLTLILVATFIIAQGEADTRVGMLLSYIPLTSPIVMPIRIALGESNPFEWVVSCVILVLSILLVARVGSRVYARAIVHTGRRLKLRDLMGAGRTTPADHGS